MRLTSSTHNHTNLCDGRNTPDEMARAALEAGFTDFGFSGHSYAPFDLDYSVKSEQHYVQELRALQRHTRAVCALPWEWKLIGSPR